MENADGRYSYRAWDRRPGDGVDPSPVVLDAERTILEVAAQTPMPVPAAPPVNFTGDPSHPANHRGRAQRDSHGRAPDEGHSDESGLGDAGNSPELHGCLVMDLSSEPYVFDTPVRDLTARGHYPPMSRHEEMMEGFHSARNAWNANRERGEGMQMEDDEYREASWAPTVKEFMRR